jgi:hypothetical protein
MATDEPKSVREDMTVGEFVDGLPPHELTATVNIGGKWWHVKRIDIKDDGDGD